VQTENDIPSKESAGALRRYETLMQVADLMVDHRDVTDLFSDLADRLQSLAAFETASFALHDPAKDAMWVHTWQSSAPAITLAEAPTHESLSGWVWKNQKPLIVPEQTLDTPCFPKALDWLNKRGLESYCTVPMTTSQRRLGTIGIGSRKPGAYEGEDMQLLLRVADLVALAVENALTRAALQREKDRFHALLNVGKVLVSNRKPEELFREISASIRRVVGHDYASLSLYDKPTNSFQVHMLDLPFAKGFVGFYPMGPDLVIPLEETIAAGPAFLSRETHIVNYQDMVRNRNKHNAEFLQQGFRSLCCMPLITGKGVLGTLNLASMRDAAFLRQDIGFLNQLAAQIAVAWDNAKAYNEIAELTDKLKKEKLYLQDEIRNELNFEEIIGESPVLKRVLSQVKTVAPSDATALILGETGTGKELIARAIHRLSSRKNNSFIKLNCAAIPTGLLESELFGHEKGAFTGAVTQKIGRLELADKGTLFLDEVGDIPPELQPKLLRVLQDQEFERLGGNRTIHVNIRLVAATNRNLAEAVAAHEFRSDLYYRLNVFPIHTPALRERPQDIPLLVRYFVQKLSRKMNKRIDTIPTETMNALIRWEWPGNVRELENFVERSVILTEGPVLNVPLAELRDSDLESEIDGTLESMERAFIVRVLRETGGVIAGARGAAVRLGLKRTTLQSRMLKLGISRHDYVD